MKWMLLLLAMIFAGSFRGLAQPAPAELRVVLLDGSTFLAKALEAGRYFLLFRADPAPLLP